MSHIYISYIYIPLKGYVYISLLNGFQYLITLWAMQSNWLFTLSSLLCVLVAPTLPQLLPQPRSNRDAPG